MPAKKKIYLDHAAATPLDPAVRRAMEPFLSGSYGNASSIHSLGVEARRAVEVARVQVATFLGCRPGEVVFTAGGTEANNIAILGQASKSHIITTAIEHPSVLEACRAREARGGSVTYVPVSVEGIVDVKKITRAVKKSTSLVSVAYVNGEIGTVQPIQKIGRAIRLANIERKARGWLPIALHVDACQATPYYRLDVHRLGADLLTVNGSKAYGPKQVGALHVSRHVALAPTLHGGGQEAGLRSGTENVAGAVGLGKALELAATRRARDASRLAELRDYLFEKLLAVDGVAANGVPSGPAGSAERSPANVNVSVPGLDGEALVVYLDRLGVMASTGSACSSARVEPSPVLLATGRTRQEASSSLRFTLGRATTRAELDRAAGAFARAVALLRRA